MKEILSVSEQKPIVLTVSREFNSGSNLRSCAECLKTVCCIFIDTIVGFISHHAEAELSVGRFLGVGFWGLGAGFWDRILLIIFSSEK